MRNTLFTLFLFAFLLGHSQDAGLSLAAASVPEGLKKDADAVYRLDEGRLTVLSPSEYTLKVHQTITLLNADGAHYLHHKLGTDKFYKVEEAEVKVYDALGLLQKKYGLKDFETEAAFDGFTLVNDDKVMKLYTPASMYPCTVDIQYKIHATGYVELPNWYISNHYTSTEKFRYEVTVPSNIDIRHRTLNFAITPKAEDLGNQKHYVWEAQNIKAKKWEPDGFESALYLPQVEVSPNEFSYDGYKGSFRSWQDFGSWNYKLYEEKAPFNEQRIAEIKALVAKTNNREEKISVLYDYLQRNMRYVSIQLGIGGFKPFAVKFVDEKKYGDCKALTNYMRYLLKVAGIEAYPALINAGNEKISVDPKFPSDPFNHVILCIPGAKDSTWLECTSNYSKVGELGTFTENKKVLLLTENGGVLVNTPKSLFSKNLVETRNEVIVDAEGGAIVRNKTRSSGEANAFYKYLVQSDADVQKEKLIKQLHYKSPDELELSASDEKNGAALAVQRSYEKLYDFKTGNKYFFPLCINPLAIQDLKTAKRETDFLFPYPFEKRDTTIFQFPTGFSPETLPADKELTTSYTRYKRTDSYNKATNQLTIISTLCLTQHVIPAADYIKTVQFFNDVKALEEENLVLTKQ